jgi:indole-3-glycerol phosphate synthase
MSVLAQIIEYKKKEVARQKTAVPVGKLEMTKFFNRETISLKSSLAKRHTAIITEFKRRSPSKGVINDEADIMEVATGYERAGAAALSVLTDHHYFGGQLEDIQRVRNEVSIPVLRKEFIIDEYQLLEAKAAGADAVLLIAAVLSVKQTKKLAAVAGSLGLEVLLELHDGFDSPAGALSLFLYH